MPLNTSNSIAFLNAAYQDLDLQNGSLIKISQGDSGFDIEEFVNKGQWLKLGQYLNEKNEYFNIDSIFFVENNPVIVFADVPNVEKQQLHEVYNQIWCMARPRLLFLATPTELNVYDLANSPFKKEENLKRSALDSVEEIAKVASKLKEFHRAKVETGKLFGDERFESNDSLADQALIQNLKEVRRQLMEKGLNASNGNLKYAHALIGRSIFIRYLEDRGILTANYFYDIAAKNSEWKQILDTPPEKPHFNPDMDKLLYPKVLKDKNFTYALFRKLSEDFNGDIFPTDNEEENTVNPHHLSLIQDFLRGDNKKQKKLFFWAYKFDIIPIELISSIYEEFYYFDKKVETARKNKKPVKDDKGTHYTPASLVEFTLSRVLTPNILAQKPAIIDPACGSGIFLVEAFRRVVRYETIHRKKSNLSFEELLEILKTQIAGIELNREAVKIAAFSLYLAFLHYQKPPDIRYQIKEKKNKLPHLIYTDFKKRGKKYFDILIASNAFDIENTVKDKKVKKRFSSGSFDVVVGNPPWGTPRLEDKKGRFELNIALKWCTKNNFIIGDKEPSQAFLWRALDMVKKNGKIGLLVSSGTLYKCSPTNIRFKKQLLFSNTITEVINFSHVRKVYFNSGTSPFLAVFFEKRIFNPQDIIKYYSVRRSRIIEETLIVTTDYTDFKFFRYSQIYTQDIWKIFWFGNHMDFSLISGLRVYPLLIEKEKKTHLKSENRRQGFTQGKKKVKPVSWLKKYKEYPTKWFNYKYGELDLNNLPSTPNKVEGQGDENNYKGDRILFKGGITEKTEPKGQIIIRYENKEFAYRHSINCIKLQHGNADDYKVLVGIFWSSLSRYYFFMTASRWGGWHDDILLTEILHMPVVFPQTEILKKRIVDIVDKLRKGLFLKKEKENNQLSLFKKNSNLRIKEELENELDDAIFELYELTQGEIDLIKDRCKYDIHHFYHHSESIAVKPLEESPQEYGLFSTLPKKLEKQIGIQSYLSVFLKNWNTQVEYDKELNWKVIQPNNSPMIAVIFNLQDKGELDFSKISQDEDEKWEKLLMTLDEDTRIPYSKNVYVEGIIRDVRLSENRIIIIKRNEQRLWTRSAAREDVEATILQAAIQQS